MGAQVAAILNMMGYEAVALEWGMASWAGATDSPASYNKTRDTVSDWGTDYTSGATAGPTETYPFPVVENTESPDKAAIILAAANAYLTNGTRRFDMKSSDLYQALKFNPQTAAQLFLSTFFTGSATGNPYTVPFVLDIRDTASYNKGHLSRAVHVHWKDVFKTDNLNKLPSDQPVLVYGDTGHESSAVAALLSLLGYDARNLRWGIAADQFVPARDCMDYPLVSGFDPFLPCPS
jgi:rhodanese-related sulfurtransferase